jgi:hypothetical protein
VPDCDEYHHHHHEISVSIKMLFTDPVEVSTLEEYIASDPGSFEEALSQA